MANAREKTVGAMKCCVPLCSSASRKSIAYFSFPKRKKFKEEWVKVLSEMDLYRNIVGKEGPAALSRLRICSRHFSEEDFISSAHPSKKGDSSCNTRGQDNRMTVRRSLKEDAVPSIFIENVGKSNREEGHDEIRSKRVSRPNPSNAASLVSEKGEVPFAAVALCMKEAVNSFKLALQNFERSKEQNAPSLRNALPPKPSSVIDINSIHGSASSGETARSRNRRSNEKNLPVAVTNTVIKQERMDTEESPKADVAVAIASIARRVTRNSVHQVQVKQEIPEPEAQSCIVSSPVDMKTHQKLNSPRKPTPSKLSPPSPIDKTHEKLNSPRKPPPSPAKLSLPSSDSNKTHQKLKSPRKPATSPAKLLLASPVDIKKTRQKLNSPPKPPPKRLSSSPGRSRIKSTFGKNPVRKSAPPSMSSSKSASLPRIKNKEGINISFKQAANLSLTSSVNSKSQIKQTKRRTLLPIPRPNVKKQKRGPKKRERFSESNISALMASMRARNVSDDSERKQAGFVQSMFSQVVTKVFSEEASQRIKTAVPIVSNTSSGKPPWEFDDDNIDNGARAGIGNGYVKYEYDSYSNTVRLPEHQILDLNVDSDEDNGAISALDPLDTYHQNAVKLDAVDLNDDDYGTPLLNGFGIDMESGHGVLESDVRNEPGNELMITPEGCEYASDASECETADATYYALIPKIEVNDEVSPERTTTEESSTATNDNGATPEIDSTHGQGDPAEVKIETDDGTEMEMTS